MSTTMYIFVNYGEIYDLIWFDLVKFCKPLIDAFFKGVVPRNFHNQKKPISYEGWAVLRSLKKKIS